MVFSGETCKKEKCQAVCKMMAFLQEGKQHKPQHLVSRENFKAENKANSVTAANPARINHVCTTPITSVNLRYNIQGFLVTTGTAASLCPIQHPSTMTWGEAQEWPKPSLGTASTLWGHPKSGWFVLCWDHLPGDGPASAT